MFLWIWGVEQKIPVSASTINSNGRWNFLGGEYVFEIDV